MTTYSRAGQFGPAAISGAPAGVSLRVLDAAGSSDAVLYADASKNKTVGPVVQSTDAGLVSFFADPGTYTVRWTGGSTTVTVTGGTEEAALNQSGVFAGEVIGTDFKATGTTGAPNQGRFVGVTTSGPPASGTYQVGDFAVTQNGNMVVCTVAGTPGTWTNPRELTSSLSSGEEVCHRLFSVASGQTFASGTLQLTYFTARRTESINTLVAYSSGTAAATVTLIRYGIYSVAANGDLTLVASTANDATLLTSTFTRYPKATSSAWSKVAGVRYAAGVLFVGTTPPTLYCCNAQGASVYDTMLFQAPVLSSVLTGQTDLPSSVASASLAASRRMPYMEMLP